MKKTGGARGRATARRRMRVGVIFGGRSVEHEVSLVSARAIMDALDPRRYEVVPIGITRQGRWVLGGSHCALPPDPSVHGLVRLRNGGGSAASAMPLPPSIARTSAAARSAPRGRIDVIVPMVHGTGGEDGTLQGLLELADIPYVGAGVLGSALGMDKAMMKVVFREAGLPIVDHRVIRRIDLATGRDRFLKTVEDASASARPDRAPSSRRRSTWRPATIGRSSSNAASTRARSNAACSETTSLRPAFPARSCRRTSSTITRPSTSMRTRA